MHCEAESSAGYPLGSGVEVRKRADGLLLVVEVQGGGGDNNSEHVAASTRARDAALAHAMQQMLDDAHT